MRTALLLLLTACVHLPHIDPESRTPDQEAMTVVHLEVSCTDPNPFKTGEPGDPHALDPDIDWGSKSGTGVIISERHVLTAAHVVQCPTIPVVIATLPDGRWQFMDVVRDDAMFGNGDDLARLEIASADTFHIRVAPPRLVSWWNRPGPGTGMFIPLFRREPVRGLYRGYRGIVDGATTRHGDSGAPVYDANGDLVGLVVAGPADGSYTKFFPILDDSWLAGT